METGPSETVSSTGADPVDLDEDPPEELTVEETCEAFDVLDCGSDDFNVNDQVLAYVCGNVIRRFVSCPSCKAALCAQTPCEFVKAKTLDGCHMIHPQPVLVSAAKQLQTFIFNLLPEIGHLPNVTKVVLHRCTSQGIFKFSMNCSLCKTDDVVRVNFIKFFIKLYCKLYNKKIKDSSRSATKKLNKLTK